MVQFSYRLWGLFIYAIRHESSPQAAAMTFVTAVKMITMTMPTWRPVITMPMTARWDRRRFAYQITKSGLNFVGGCTLTSSNALLPNSYGPAALTSFIPWSQALWICLPWILGSSSAQQCVVNFSEAKKWFIRHTCVPFHCCN